METDGFDRAWITQNAIEICAEYEHGVLTLRGLHYQLVGRGMTNSLKHYKRVVSAMIKARREGLVAYSQFSDHDREALGQTKWRETVLETEIEAAKEEIEAWMTHYAKNRWERQSSYVEVWIEKKALQGTFRPIARALSVALCPCKGYPSLTFLHQASNRFKAAEREGREPVIVYFGDHDPSGEDIPRSIGDNLSKDFGVSVTVDVRALTAQQCLDMELPPAPTKVGDSRSAKFTGIGQVELDAVPPETLQRMASEGINAYLDPEILDQVKETEAKERKLYREAMVDFVTNFEEEE
jgi:hypothetical protein